jgi:hypothetical protein
MAEKKEDFNWLDVVNQIYDKIPEIVVKEDERFKKSIMKKNDRGLLSCFTTVLLQEI